MAVRLSLQLPILRSSIDSKASTGIAYAMEVPRRYLTKSLVRLALKCPRKLVYASNPALYPRSNDAGEDSLLKHLSKEGERFGEYCKQRLFPHGVEVGKDATVLDDTLQFSRENLVSQTRDMLLQNTGERVTIFEGAVQHGHFFARPDILDRTVDTNDTPELRLIEVKSKSWDSRHSAESKLWTANKKSIKSTYLSYIQDVAFQKMVCSLAYPDFRVSAWLMMPDRAKRMKQLDDEHVSSNQSTSFEDTLQTIDDSIATLINVDDVVAVALASKVQYPGSKNAEPFRDIVQKWAEEINDEKFGLDSFPTRVGPHCAACEYRVKNITGSTRSGFDICWSRASGTELGKTQSSPPVVDLFGNAKVAVKSFVSEGKYHFADLSRVDFDLLEETASKGRKKASDGISAYQRQWYQVKTEQRERGPEYRPNHIIRRSHLKQAMKKWRFPLHFIDFETASPAMPYYNGTSPYDVFAFQYSHHTMRQNEDGLFVVEHASEFLHTDRSECPNIPFLKALYRSIGSVVTYGSTVFQWSPYEASVLRAMLASEEVTAALAPEELSALSAIRSSLVDLCDVAQKYYYVDGSGGSSSMKRLLKPTLNASPHLKSIYGAPKYNGSNFTNLQWYQLDELGNAKDPYEILAALNSDQHASAKIAVGGAAASAFNDLQTSSDLTDEDRAAIEAALLRYCELDTLAMVMMVQAWQGFLNEEDRTEPQ